MSMGSGSGDWYGLPIFPEFQQAVNVFKELGV
jgi:hypothetical protein